MISIVEQILGQTYGFSSYDDVIIVGALTLGIMALLLVVAIFKYILHK